jgi:TonB family protein
MLRRLFVPSAALLALTCSTPTIAALKECCTSPNCVQPRVYTGCCLPGTSRGSSDILPDYTVNRPEPEYPAAAKAAHISGQVVVRIVIDERGRVVWARAISGHRLLQEAALKAACHARFRPIRLVKAMYPTMRYGKAVKYSGSLEYSFVLQ